MSVTYTATLNAREATVLFLSHLLHAERRQRGTRAGRRALSCFQQAVLIIRWFVDGTRVLQLAHDNAISTSTSYDYLHEGIDVLAAQAPNLHGALLAAKAAGYGHITIDGTLIATDRVSAPGPTAGVDLWWSGKHGANTNTTAATSRSSPPQTAGRSGPPRYGPAASTTPPRCEPTPRSCPPWSKPPPTCGPSQT
jgi:hypothetical protein